MPTPRSFHLLLVVAMLSLLCTGCARKVPPAELQFPWLVIETRRDPKPRTGFGQRGDDELIIAGAFFRFYADGTATTIFNRVFHVGTWEFDEPTQEITLKVPNRETRRLRVHRIDADHMRFSQTEPAAGLHFEVELDTFDYGDQDIYSPEMNAWRVRSADYTEAALRGRMLNMLRFLEAYFEAGYIKNLETVDIAALPTPFIFAANGIALAPRNRMSPRWFALFESSGAADRAVKILAGTFRGVVAPATTNRFERNSVILSQMADNLEREIAATANGPVPGALAQ